MTRCSARRRLALAEAGFGPPPSPRQDGQTRTSASLPGVRVQPGRRPQRARAASHLAGGAHGARHGGAAGRNAAARRAARSGGVSASPDCNRIRAAPGGRVRAERGRGGVRAHAHGGRHLSGGCYGVRNGCRMTRARRRGGPPTTPQVRPPVCPSCLLAGQKADQAARGGCSPARAGTGVVRGATHGRHTRARARAAPATLPPRMAGAPPPACGGAPATTPPGCHYDALGVAADATAAQIRDAYKRAVRRPQRCRSAVAARAACAMWLCV